MHLRRVLPALTAGVILACSAPEQPPDAEAYRLVATTLRARIDAPARVLLHPLLIQRGDAGIRLDLSTFNVFDSTTVAAAAALDDGLSVCRQTRAGSCEVPEGVVAMALSEMEDLGRNGVGIGAVVTDGRGAAPGTRYYMVRLRAGSGEWEVLNTRRVRP